MISLMVGIDHKSSNLRLDGTAITQRTRKPPQATRRSGCGNDFTSVKGRIPFHCNSLWVTMIVIVIHCLSCQLERLLSHQRYWNLTQAAIGFNPFSPFTRSNQTTPPDGAWPQLGWRWSSQATRLEMFETFGTQYKQCQWDYVRPLLLGYCCHRLSQLDQVTQNFRPVRFCFTGHQIRCSICYIIFNQMILPLVSLSTISIFFAESVRACKHGQKVQVIQFKIIPKVNSPWVLAGFVDTNLGEDYTVCKIHQSFHASVVGVLFHRLCATRNCHISLFSQNATVFKIESRIEAYVLKHRQRGTRKVSFYRYDMSTLVSNRYVTCVSLLALRDLLFSSMEPPSRTCCGHKKQTETPLTRC